MKTRPLLHKIVIGIVGLFLLGAWLDRLQEAHQRRKGSLAIVHITGLIRTSSTAPTWGNPDAEEIARQLHRLSEDRYVKAILLRVNSPGGTVGAVQEISREIQQCKAKGKIVVASLADVAASGGYYVAAAADRIVANPGTITGSIGVILQFADLEGLFQKVGLKLEVVKSGAFKDMGSPARALSPEERRLLQACIDDAFAQFVEAVRQGRGLAPEKVKALADGRVFTGRQALDVKLVDELGNEQDAIQTAIRLAKLPEKPFLVMDEKPSFSSFVRQASARFTPAPWADLKDALANAGLEYRWAP
jgi:protease IV